MADGPDSLDDLRAEIDRIDGEMHDLLMKRAAAVRQMVAAKDGSPSMRPAREMEILRGLAARHDGAMPLASIVHIWREIMAASLALQGDFKIYLPGDDLGPGLWDLARFHFGAATNLVAQGNPANVIKEIGQGTGDIGVLPVPQLEDEDPWWTHLLFAGEGGPRVVARLPMLANAPGYNFPDAFAVANLTQRPTGNDATLIAALTGSEFSRDAGLSAFKGQGLEAQFLALAPEAGGNRFMLFEVSEYMAEDDARFAALEGQSAEIFELRSVGGYARPIECAATQGGGT